MSRRSLVSALTVTMLAAAITFAQQPNQRPAERRNADQDRPAARQPGQPAAQASSQGDSQLATCLIIDNQNEIALAQFALQKTQNEEVKAFAQQLMQDHEQFVSELQKFADASGAEGARPTPRRTGQPDAAQPSPRRESNEPGAANNPADSDRPSPAAQRNPQPAEARDAAQPNADANPDQANPARRDAANPNQPGRDAAQPGEQPRTAQRATALEDGQLDFMAIKKELAQTCLESIQKELSSKPENEFDKCYLTQQIMAHMQMLDTLKVFSNHSSPELRAVLQKGQETAEQHLEHAKKLEKQVAQAATN